MATGLVGRRLGKRIDQLKPPLPFVPGMEMAGEIVAINGDGGPFRVGDRVCGGTRIGSFAEYAAVPVAGLRYKPATLDMAQASAYGAAYLTAYVALVRRGHLLRDETLLVHGAAGGVGPAAVDMGLFLGATVIATASSDEKRSGGEEWRASLFSSWTVSFNWTTSTWVFRAFCALIRIARN